MNISSVAVEEASYEKMKYMTKTITKIEMWKYEFKGMMQIIAKKSEKLLQARREEIAVSNEGLKAKEVNFIFLHSFSIDCS